MIELPKPAHYTYHDTQLGEEFAPPTPWFSEEQMREALKADRPDEQPDACFEGFLCRAWGETELPCAEVVRDMDGVRRFIVREWLNDDSASDLPAILEQIKADIEREKAWCISFEIGGASVAPVYSFVAPSPLSNPSN